MKHFRLLALAAILLSALSMTTYSANFSFTVKWDIQGAVTIHKGTGDSAPLDIAETATDWTGTENGDTYWFKPATGYIITNVHEIMMKDGRETESDLRLSGNERFGQYVNKFIGAAHNGAVYTITTKKLNDAGEITLDVANGIGKFDAWFKNSKSGEEGESLSTYRKPEITKGEQNIALTENENYLNIYPNGTSKIHEVSLNGAVQPLFYGGFEVPVKDGDKVTIRVHENDPAQYDVNLKFANGENCLETIYNRATGKFIYPDEMEAMNNRITVDDGDQLSFNFNEDYDITAVRLNGNDAGLAPSAASYRLTVTENSEVEFIATPKVYEDLQAVLYIKDADGIVIRTEADPSSEIIPLGDGEDLKEDIVIKVSEAYDGADKKLTMKKGEVRKYTVNVPGKNRKYFWSAADGYWVSGYWKFKDFSTEAEMPSPSVEADGSMVYLEARKINPTRQLVVFFEGAEKEAKIFCKNPVVAGYLPIEGLGDEFYVPTGYTISAYDPDYHVSFSTGKVGLPKDKMLQVFVNSSEVKQADDGSFPLSFPEDPAILKIFSRDARVINYQWEVTDEVNRPSICFEVEDGCSADVTYDMIFRHTDLSQPLNVIGKTLIVIKPAAGTFVLANGVQIEADENGECHFWAGDNRRETVSLTTETGLTEIVAAQQAENRIYNIHGVELKSPFTRLPAGIYIINGRKVVK